MGIGSSASLEQEGEVPVKHAGFGLMIAADRQALWYSNKNKLSAVQEPGHLGRRPCGRSLVAADMSAM